MEQRAPSASHGFLHRPLERSVFRPLSSEWADWPQNYFAYFCRFKSRSARRAHKTKKRPLKERPFELMVAMGGLEPPTPAL